MSEREIWFVRVFIGYIPCHWKGWLLTVAVAAVGIFSILLLHIAFRFRDDSLSGLIYAIPILVGVAYLGFVATRHSK
jgi:hypothetical protein